MHLRRHRGSSFRGRSWIVNILHRGFVCKLFEKFSLVVLHNKPLIVRVMELIVVLLATLRSSLSYILKRGRKPLVPRYLFFKDFAILVILIGGIEHEQAKIDFTFLETTTIISLFHLLYHFSRPSQIHSLIIFALSSLCSEEPLD